MVRTLRKGLSSLIVDVKHLELQAIGKDENFVFLLVKGLF
jgi:hypothetical protein